MFKRILILFVSVILVLGSVSCAKTKDNEKAYGDTASDTTASVESNDTDKGDTPADDTAYTWALEPGKILEGDIQPLMTYPDNIISAFGVSLLTTDQGGFLIDYEGNTKAVLPNNDFSYCSVCARITDHESAIDPVTYEITKDIMGHDGVITQYIYDTAGGEIYTPDMGGYYPCEFTLSYGVVQSGEKTEVAPDNLFGMDYDITLNGTYGIVVNGKAVTDLDYTHAIPFDNGGVAALCRDGKWGYYNKEGVEILPHEYDGCIYAIDPTGNGQGYDMPYSSSYGYIALCRDGKWGYSDTRGNMVTEFCFNNARPVHAGKAWVETDKGWGVISLNGYTDDSTPEEAKEILRQGIQELYERYSYYSTFSIVDIQQKEQTDPFYGTACCYFTLTEDDGNGYINATDYLVTDDGIRQVCR